MRLILVLAAAATMMAACDYRQAEPKVTVEGAWVQLPVVSDRPGAAYFTLRTNNDPTKLVAVSSPRIDRIELHGTMMEGNIARMGPLADTVFDPGEAMIFAPGGNHAMLFGLDPALKSGDKIALTFTVEPMDPVTIEAEVRAFGAGHGGH